VLLTRLRWVREFVDFPFVEMIIAVVVVLLRWTIDDMKR
jgi:hypothetical protein